MSLRASHQSEEFEPHCVLYSFSVFSFDPSWSTIIITITVLTRTSVTTRRRNNFNNKSWASFWIFAHRYVIDLVRFIMFSSVPYTRLAHLPEMFPTTMLADEVVGWYTPTSTSALFSFCRESILKVKSKSK